LPFNEPSITRPLSAPRSIAANEVIAQFHYF